MKKCPCTVYLSQQETNDITRRALGEHTPVREDRFGEAVSNARLEGSMAGTDWHGPRARAHRKETRHAASLRRIKLVENCPVELNRRSAPPTRSRSSRGR